MKIKAGILGIGISGLILLTGCNSRKIQKDTRFTDGINEFSVDGYAVRKEDRASQSSSSSQEVEIRDPADEISSTLGLLEVLGEDLSVDYVRENDDITYNGVIYKGLGLAADKTPVPCGKETFINFVVKTFAPKGTEVNVQVTLDSEIDPDSTRIRTDEGVAAQYGDKYTAISSKFGADVNWNMLIEEKDRQVIIYGCNQYMLQCGTDNTVSVDMSKYDTGTRASIEDTGISG